VTSLLEWLFDLEHIRLARDAPLRLEWHGGLEPWFVFGGAVVTAILLAVIYRRERVSSARRIALACIRFALMGLVVAVLARPTLVLQRNRVDPSHIVLLLDASQSMANRDVYLDPELGEAVARGAGVSTPPDTARHTRRELLSAALSRDGGEVFRHLPTNNPIQVFEFAGAAEAVAHADSGTDPSTVVDALSNWRTDGATTDLPGAIAHVLQRAQGRRVAAIVLASDGRSTEPTGLTKVLDLARSRRVPVYPLRIGSPTEPRDVHIATVRAEESVFLSDLLAIEVEVGATGLSEPLTVEVALIDTQTESTIATAPCTLAPEELTRTVELRTKPARTGQHRYRVHVTPLPGELHTDDNSEVVDVSVLDDRIDVLYVEGYPRFEYRYLKNAFVREETMRVSVLLLEADERFVQEGTEPIRRFPESPEELLRYDVVFFGDVDPRAGWITTAQMDMLLDFVSNEGGGFALIAGERSTPHRFLGTPLEKLIPVRIDPEFLGRYEAPLTTGYRPVLTAEGRRSRIFRFLPDPEANRAVVDALPEVYWIARTLGAKAGATVLAEHPTMQSPLGPMPVVVLGRYGAGKILFQATDDVWRWRRRGGEFLVDTYWIQVARDLIQARRIARDRRYVVRGDRRRYNYGQEVRVDVDIPDTELLSQQGAQLPMLLTDARGLTVARFDLQRVAPDASIFEGTVLPPSVGSFTVQAARIAPRPGEREPTALIRVDRPDVESRYAGADHETLRRIAEATSGAIIDLDRVSEVFDAIQDRSAQTPDDLAEPLWDSKVILGLFVLMISAEWILRKVFNLL
jgi:hypothetical protein